jgi:hypothetical protein
MRYTRRETPISEWGAIDRAVFKTPIETVVTLWIAKYGTDWVDSATVDQDPFFGWVKMRLHRASRIETHSIVSNGAYTDKVRILD